MGASRVARALLTAQAGRHARPTPRQKRIALVIAGAADLVQLALAPLLGEGALSPLDFALDVAVAIALVATLGWRWRTAIALAAELVPGLALFPTWTAVIALLPTAEGPLPALPRDAAQKPTP